MVSDNLLQQGNNKPIPHLLLTLYLRMGFKLVPLSADSKTPAVSSTNDIYNNPDYWTEEKLVTDDFRFSNVAITFGLTRTPGSESKQSSKVDLHCLDIDSDNVLAILFDLVKELKSKTFVTKTKKDCGYHIYWLSHTQHQAIGRSKCRASYEFEIKSDNSLGLCTLPPSIHRDDPNFKYQSIGTQQKNSH